MPIPPSPGRVIAALLFTMTLWASSFAVIKSAGSVYGAGELATLRFSIAILTLALFSLAGRPRLPRGRAIFWFFASGFLGVTIYHPFLNYGEQVVSAGTASLLINSAPVWTALFAALLLRETISPRRALGISISFLGVALLAFSHSDTGALSFQPAALFIVGSAICAAFYVIVQKRFLSHYNAHEFTLWTCVAGVLLLLPIFAIPTLHKLAIAPLRPTLEIAYLGIFPGALAYMTFAYGTVHLPASRVMSFMYLVPALAMLIAFLYLGEIPTPLAILGGVLAIGGVAIVNAPARAKRSAAPASIVETIPVPEEG